MNPLLLSLLLAQAPGARAVPTPRAEPPAHAEEAPAREGKDEKGFHQGAKVDVGDQWTSV